MKRRRKIRSDKPSNKLISFAIAVVVIILCVVVNAKSRTIKAQNEADQGKIKELQNELVAEKARNDALNDYEKYVNTKQFVEDVARAKFGLIYPDEIIFKSDK